MSVGKNAFTKTEPQNHNSENTWYTPKDFVSSLGEFDLDPCSNSTRPFDIAKTHIEHDLGQDGLVVCWKDKRCFINPPYGVLIGPFIKKFIEEKPKGFLLIFARMGSKEIQSLIKAGAYFFFLRKRIHFVEKSGAKKNKCGNRFLPSFLASR